MTVCKKHPALCLSLLMLFFLSTRVYSEGPDIMWTRTYGGSGADIGHSMDLTSDGGFIITGDTGSGGAMCSDVYLIRLDAEGDTLWTRTYSNADTDMPDEGRSVRQTSDGGYVIAGSTWISDSLSTDIYVIKTDQNGDPTWMRSYSGTSPQQGPDYGHCVRQVDDGGYIVSGKGHEWMGYTDVFLIRLEPDGDTLWTRSYQQPDWHSDVLTEPTSDGGYVLAGTNMSMFNADIFLIRTDEDGDTLWTRTFGGQNPIYGRSLQVATDGGYVVAGNAALILDSDILLMKTDENGNELWTRTYDSGRDDYGYSVDGTSDGGYIIAGHSLPREGDSDVFLIRTDANGDTLWTCMCGGEADDLAYSVRQTPDGGFIVVGSTESFGADSIDVYVVRFVEGIPPELGVGILQNPYLSRYLDIYMVASETLDSESIDVKANDKTTDMLLLDPDEHVWMGDYTLSPGETEVSIEACASDVAGNRGCVTSAFSAALLLAGPGGSLSSPDGAVTLNVPPGALGSDTYVTVLPCVEVKSQAPGSSGGGASLRYLAPEGTTPASYHIGPVGALTGGGTYVEFRYAEADLEPGCALDQLYIEQEGLGQLACEIDPNRRVVGAGISRLGTFRLAVGPRGSSPVRDPSYLWLEQVYPNPSGETVSLRFSVGLTQRVSVSIYDVAGREVISLMDGVVETGLQEVIWNGRAMDGNPVSDGVYLIRVQTENTDSVRKIVLVR